MYHDLPFTARFWWFLFAIDQDLADAIRKIGCPCGGRLHSADYLRNPCGVAGGLIDELRIRLSFCCDRDGCRKRTTPPSVRFLGRKRLPGRHRHPHQRHAARAVTTPSP